MSLSCLGLLAFTFLIISLCGRLHLRERLRCERKLSNPRLIDRDDVGGGISMLLKVKERKAKNAGK
jgi:hypothetical protein